MTAESTPPPSGGADGPGAPGTAESGAEQPAPEEQGPGTGTAPPSDNRFFLWLRGLGLTRRPGWIGGVCSGIAERLGIDPLIVRGIVVVVAVLGGPALLVYAAAWLLLPDEDGALPVEQLVGGRIERVHAGIGALVLASMLPLAQGFWSLGGAYTGAEAWAPAAGRTIWTLVVIGLLLALTVWVARQAARSGRTPHRRRRPPRPERVPTPPPSSRRRVPPTSGPTPPRTSPSGAPGRRPGGPS
ncbi:PspC domain-containing protein, partial [Rathayibacter sp. VKM Ac-2630]|uniref:PspC domain-containing protein n=1 Tax=Rathayibacter sp. VKM Ac-2630 TaxID=1938617 RepID=UPI00111596E3